MTARNSSYELHQPPFPGMSSKNKSFPWTSFINTNTSLPSSTFFHYHSFHSRPTYCKPSQTFLAHLDKRAKACNYAGYYNNILHSLPRLHPSPYLEVPRSSPRDATCGMKSSTPPLASIPRSTSTASSTRTPFSGTFSGSRKQLSVFWPTFVLMTRFL